jgi:hypothetical protein
MKSPFLMNMKGQEFTSNGQLSIRAWFGRMISQLEMTASGNYLSVRGLVE